MVDLAVIIRQLFLGCFMYADDVIFYLHLRMVCTVRCINVQNLVVSACNIIFNINY